MSHIHTKCPNNKFGFQILYKNANGAIQTFEAGTVLSSAVELEITVAPLNSLFDRATMQDSGAPFTFRSIVDESRRAGCHGLAPDTLLIRYSQQLFTLLTLKKSFQRTPSLFGHFKADRYKLNASLSSRFPRSFQLTIWRIIGIITDKTARSESVYKYIQQLSDYLVDLEACRNPGINSRFELNLETLVKFTIDNHLNYPTAMDFRKFADSSKKTFERKVRLAFNWSLKCLIDHLKFKSEMYAIFYTKKPLSNISDDHGYSEQSAFSRSIKIKMGHPPLYIRKLAQNGLMNLFTQ